MLRVCWLLFVVCCSRFGVLLVMGVRCVLCVACCLTVAGVRCLLCVVYCLPCLLSDVCCRLFVVFRLLYCCSYFDVRCLLCVVC